MSDVTTLIKKLLTPEFSTVVNELSLLDTQLIIDKSDSLYYRLGRLGSQPLLTDAEYDTVRKHLRSLNPTDHRLSRVGVPYSPSELSTKVKHALPMGSLDNTDDGIAGYAPWIQWVKDKLNTTEDVTILASLKIDGGSICATYKDGVLQRVASRGNGEVGENITANAVNFRWLPTVLPQPINAEVRGEAILYKKDFEEICKDIPIKDRSNPRNIGNGILGRHDGTDSNKMRFMAFNIHSTDFDYDTEIDKLATLKQLGFTCVPHQKCHTIDDFNSFYQLTAQARDTLPFEIDGIVVVVNNFEQQEPLKSDAHILRPKYARAVKFEAKCNSTKLTGVDITVGHTGAIIPTGTLDTVRVGGVNVSNVLLNNWDEIERLNVAIGDEVEVILAGDIIPKIVRVIDRPLNRMPITEPKTCPVCQSETTRSCRGKDGAVTYCTNTKCAATVFAKLGHWIGSSKKGVGILEIGDTTIKALWDNKILQDPADLYTLTVEKIKDITLEKGSKVGEARAVKIIANIQEKKNISLATFLGSLGIELLGRRRVELLRKAANGQLDTLDDWLDINKLKTIQIPGLGDAVRTAIINGIEDNAWLIKKMVANGVSTADTPPTKPIEENEPTENGDGSKPENKSNQPLANYSFCWTGTRELIDEVQQLGGVVKSGISKGLNYLVQKDALSTSVKTTKAESLGVTIISVDYLRKVVKGEATL